MTCVVGLVERGRVWMGADSVSGDTGQWIVNTERTPKVFLRDGLLIGFTSSWRMGQLLRWKLQIPQHPADLDAHEWLATAFVDAVRECLKAGGYAKKENEVEQGGTFLVGYRGRLFEILGDYQAAEPAELYTAVGCGRQFALGSLHSTVGHTPVRRVDTALKSAEYFSAYVRGPFQILSDDDAIRVHSAPDIITTHAA